MVRDFPRSVLFPAITRARELFQAGPVLANCSGLRQVIDLPIDLSVLDGDERKAVTAFLRGAKRSGADQGYVAVNRKAWWSVGLKEPAPILATYMARRPPAFVRNRAEARHINIAHGLYPREPLGENVLICLANFLSKAISVSDGRTYAGGLTKFEPREMERIIVPEPALLLQLEG
jgi:adenine-specific DNA-methyltransferase